LSIRNCPKCAGPIIGDPDKCSWCGHPLQRGHDSRQSMATEEHKRHGSGETIGVDWKAKHYAFTAALQSHVQKVLCPRCNKLIDYEIDANAYACSYCGAGISRTKAEIVLKPLFPLVQACIQNLSEQTLEGLRVVSYIDGDLTDEWEQTLPPIPPRESQNLNEINPTLHTEKLPITRTPANIHLRVNQDDDVLYAGSSPVWVLPYNQMIFRDEQGTKYHQLLASFVTSMDPRVIAMVNSAKKHLLRLTHSKDFSGYQDKGKTVNLQVNALYDALAEYGLSYIGPPPRYGIEETQDILLPKQSVEERHGCCLDLAVLFASCLERIDLDAIIFMTRVHAFPGYFLSSISDRFKAGNYWEGGVTYEFDEVNRMINKEFIPFESTCLSNLGFADAARLIEKRWELHSGMFEAAIDVQYQRLMGVAPLPV